MLATRFALAAPVSWDGTWAGGFEGGQRKGFQVIMAGNSLIGLYAEGDYRDDATGSVDAAGTLTISFGTPRQTLVLRRTDDHSATATYRDASGHGTTLTLQRD